MRPIDGRVVGRVFEMCAEYKQTQRFVFVILCYYTLLLRFSH